MVSRMFSGPSHTETFFIARARVRLFAVLATIVTVLPIPAFAGSNTGMDALKIPVGAYGASLGQAYTALAEGIEAINWNPAGLATTPASVSNPTAGVTLTHQASLADTSLDHFGLVLPSNPGRATALGLNLIRLSYGSQEGRTLTGEKDGTFNSADLVIGLAAARRIGIAMMGGQLKILRQDLAGVSAQGYAVDFGIRAPGPIDRLTLGASVRNLGPRMRLVQESFRLPLTLSFGSAYRVTGPLSLLVDVNSRPYQKQTTVSAGMEFAAARSVMLRAGYLARLSNAVVNSQQSETERGALGLYGLAGGLGLRFGQFAMDYAITPFGELGNSQTLTLASWFGGDSLSASTNGSPEIEGSDVPGTGRSILILPMDHEEWWNDLR